MGIIVFGYDKFFKKTNPASISSQKIAKIILDIIIHRFSSFAANLCRIHLLQMTVN